MKYKLIGIDMDGTLLDDEKSISPQNLRVLKKAQEKGIRIAISTGRNHHSAGVYLKYLGLKASIVANNGGYIQFEEGTTTIVEMETSKIMEVLAHAENLNLHYNLVTPKQIYYHTRPEKHKYYYGDNKMVRQSYLVPYKIINSVNEVKYFQEKVMKVHIFEDDPKRLEEFIETMPNRKAFDITRGGEDVVEICAKKASKGLALKTIADHYGIPQQQVMAFGDSGNDLSMIQYAGLGIAMENAMDILKKQADYITLSNEENGVCYGIEKFIVLE